MEKRSRIFIEGIIAALFMAGMFFLPGCNEVEPEWQVEYSTDNVSEFVERLAVDNSGNIVIGADAYLKSGQDVSQRALVVKYDNRGTLLWSYTSDLESDRLFAMTIDGYDNIYVAGSAPDGTYVMKVTPSGSLAWSVDSLDGDWVTGTLVLADGTLYLGNKNIYAFDPQTGAVLWNIPTGMETTGMAAGSGGVIYAAGYSYLGAFTSSGQTIWLVDTPRRYTAVSLVMDGSGNLFACAGIQGESRVCTFQIDTGTGNITKEVFESVDSFWNPQIGIDGSGNVVMAVSSDDSDPGRLVVKYTNGLSRVWAHRFASGKRYMDLDQLIVAHSGNIFITGGDTTVKISAQGEEIASVTTGTQTTGNRIAIDEARRFLYTCTEKEYYDNRNLLLSQYKDD